MRKKIRLSETKLKSIVKNCINEVINKQDMFSDNSEHSKEYKQFIQEIYDCFRNFYEELNGIINDYHPTNRYEYSFFEQYYKGKDGIECHLDEIRQDIDILNGEVFDPNFWA